MDEREALLAELLEPVPPSVGWWPLAPGWWVVALALTLAAIGLALAWRHRRRARAANAWRRAARAELRALRARVGDASAGDIVADASVLARRSLLAIRPREEIASLTGERWLQALDAASGGSAFTEGQGQRLAHGPYERAPSATADELGALLDAVATLIDRAEARRPGERAPASASPDPTVVKASA